MEELKSQGLVKSIGVSNYLPEHLDWIFETCKVPPAINQIEFHPYLQHEGLIEYHKEKVSYNNAHIWSLKADSLQGIATSAYGPLTAVTKGAGGPADDILNSLAKKYAVSPGEISLRWCIDQDIVPITTSSKEQRLSDYLRAMTFKLTPAEIKQVSVLCLCSVLQANLDQINEAGSQKHVRGFWRHKFDENDKR
jgi:diketogulonate reductase-like aldo/keto reductase